jgi:hypothetical protein
VTDSFNKCTTKKVAYIMKEERACPPVISSIKIIFHVCHIEAITHIFFSIASQNHNDTMLSCRHTLLMLKGHLALKVYAPSHENCSLCAFEIVEKSDTFYDGEHTFTCMPQSNF